MPIPSGSRRSLQVQQRARGTNLEGQTRALQRAQQPQRECGLGGTLPRAPSLVLLRAPDIAIVVLVVKVVIILQTWSGQDLLDRAKCRLCHNGC